MSIGLKRGTVKVVPYQKKWAVEFEKERARILAVCGDKVMAVEHIGSTSVPGLAAKPIIDIAIGVKRLKDAPKLLKPLKEIGYAFSRDFPRQRLFVAKGPEENRTHYLHLMRYQGAKWQSDQLFRNHLRTHPNTVEQYTKLKQKLAKNYPNDRQKYTEGKDKFIKGVIERTEGRV